MNKTKEIIESIVFLITLFGSLYVALWTFCPC